VSVKAVTLKNGQQRYVVRRGYNGKQRTFHKKSEAVAYATGRKPVKLVNRPSMGSAWPNYVVPTALLAPLIEAHIGQLLDQMPPDTERPNDGWRERLSERVASIRNATKESSLRRVYDIQHRKTKIINADFADATCLAFGLHIDHDTNIPTLPGNSNVAKELIEERANALNITLDPETVEKYARQAYRISLLIINYPHNADRLVKLAPLGCLEAYE